MMTFLNFILSQIISNQYMKKELIGVLNGIVKSVILILMDFLSKDKKIILQVKNVLINKKYLILKTNLMSFFK